MTIIYILFAKFNYFKFRIEYKNIIKKYKLEIN